MRNELLIAGAALLIVGAQALLNERAERLCAEDLRDGQKAQCSRRIQDALSTYELGLVKTEIEYRDRVIERVVERNTGRTQNQIKTQQDIQALGEVDETRLCATSPAFQLRREQLQRDHESGH